MAEILNASEVLTRQFKNISKISEIFYGPNKGRILCSTNRAPSFDIYLSDILEKLSDSNIAARILSLPSSDMIYNIGAGATSVILQTIHLYMALQKLRNAGYSYKSLIEMLELLNRDFVKFVDTERYSFDDYPFEKLIYALAYTSTRSDRISKFLIDVFKTAGKSGFIDIDEFDGVGLKFEHSKGINFNFKNCMPSYKPLPFENPKVLISASRIDSIEYLFEVFLHCNKNHYPLIIFTPSISNQVAEFILHNINNDAIKCNVITPYISTRNPVDSYEDLAAVAHCKLLHAHLGFKRAPVDYIGRLKFCTFKKDKCNIEFDGDISTEYINRLKTLHEKEKNRENKNYFLERISRLQSKSVKILIGKYDKLLKKEIENNLDRAIYTIRTAMTDGIIAGGAKIFYDFIKDRKIPNPIKYAFAMPFHTLIKSFREAYGFNACISLKKYECIDILRNKKVNAFNANIVDSAGIIKQVSETSISFVKTLITSKFIIGD